MLTKDLVMFNFNIGPIKVSLPLPWKKSGRHLYANFSGAYNFLQKHLSHVSDLSNVAPRLRREVSELNPASLHRIEEKKADQPKMFGQIMHLLKSPSLPNSQQILVKATAKPPVIAHAMIDEGMKRKEGSIRLTTGHRFLEWPYQILNGLNLQRFDHKVKLRDSDMDSQSSDTDENGSDDSDNDEEQGADANIHVDMNISPGKSLEYSRTKKF